MLYIGIDLGTSAVKLLLMDREGRILNKIGRASCRERVWSRV